MVQFIKRLPSMHKALGLILPAPNKLETMAHTSNSCIVEMGAEEPEIRGHLLHAKFKASPENFISKTNVAAFYNEILTICIHM